jgi:uncharacterized protein (TIGR02265 family)
MLNEKLVFAQSVEALFVRSLGPRIMREERRRLREAGLDLSEPLRPAYPLEQWKTFLRAAASAVFPTNSSEAAHFALGEHLVQGYRQTAVGRASMLLISQMGPRSTLERISHNVRAGNNFNTARVEELKDRSATLWLKDVAADTPFFSAGFLTETLRGAGAHDIRVEPIAFEDGSATFRIAWAQAARRPVSGTHAAIPSL